jgi:hypothetical protein
MSKYWNTIIKKKIKLLVTNSLKMEKYFVVKIYNIDFKISLKLSISIKFFNIFIGKKKNIIYILLNLFII